MQNKLQLTALQSSVKRKAKVATPPKEYRQGAHLPVLGLSARR